MKVNVTILVENTAPVPPLVGEYGFAALVQVDDKTIIFDTGSNDAIFTNSNILGVNLAEADEIAISHGHFDHTGAAVPIIKKFGIKKLYAHSGIFAKRVILFNGQPIRDIGSVFGPKDIEESGAELVFCNEFCEISPGVYLSGEVPRKNDFEHIEENFVIEENGQYIDDKLMDDMAMIIDHPNGLIIIAGCSHSGMINIIDHAVEKTGKSKIQAFIGGTHLHSAPPERIEKTIVALENYDIPKIVVSHCTGFYPAAKLYNSLGQKVIKGETGMSFAF